MHRMLDLIIGGGEVVDGTGAPRRRADVGIREGRIDAIGDLAGVEASTTIDAAGKLVAPGFVDVHTPYDAPGFWRGPWSPPPRHGVTPPWAGCWRKVSKPAALGSRRPGPAPTTTATAVWSRRATPRPRSCSRWRAPPVATRARPSSSSRPSGWTSSRGPST